MEREREQSAVRSGMSVELERVRGELEETQRQCQLLREASEKVNVHFFQTHTLRAPSVCSMHEGVLYMHRISYSGNFCGSKPSQFHGVIYHHPRK